MRVDMHEIGMECEMVDGSRAEVAAGEQRIWGTDASWGDPQFGAVQLKSGQFTIMNIAFLDKWEPPFETIPLFDTAEEAILFAQLQNVAYGFTTTS